MGEAPVPSSTTADAQAEQRKAYEEEEQAIQNASLCIPIRSSASFTNKNDFVEIFMDELTNIDSGAITSILRDEDAPLSVWTESALMYMRSKKPSDSLTLMNTACTELLEQQNLGSREEKVRLLAASGIGYLTRILSSSAEANRGTTNEDELSTGVFGSYSHGGAGDDAAEESRNLADNLFTRASKVDQLFPMTWIGRGMLNLSMDRIDQAVFFFKTTLESCGQVLPALLGMACVKFKEKNYQESMDMYERAIRYFPQRSGAAARVGFGLACYKLGQIDRAKAAFIRAHEIDNTNVEAMVGIAVLEMAAMDKKLDLKDFNDRTEKAIQLLVNANMIDHSNAMVQNHLANHYFWKWTPVTGVTVEVEQGSVVVKATSELNLDAGERIRIGLDFETKTVEDEDEDMGIGSTTFKIQDPWKNESAKSLQVWKKDYDRVITLAKSAYSSTSIQEIQAESLFLLARVYHVKEDMDMAYKFYNQACKSAPDLSPARFGLAQTLIWDEKYSEAALNLRIVIGNSSAATDAYAALGLLEVRAGTGREEAFSFLKKAIDMDPLNPDLVLVEALALQQQESDYPVALEKYRKAVELMEMKDIQVPWDVLTNMGVLCHETNNYDEAGKCYERALDSLDAAEDDIELAKESRLDVDSDHIRHDDNKAFWSFVDTNVTVSTSPQSNIDEEGLVVDLSQSEPSIKVGDHVRIGEDFQSVIEDISGEKVKLKDKFIPEQTDQRSWKLYVKRANKRMMKPSTISVAFNLARLHEEAGRIIPAVELHKAIIQRHPSYVNSYLRLACISRDCGSLSDCSDWLKSALVIAPGNPEVLALVGNLHLSLNDYSSAQRIFDQLIAQKVPNVQAYSMLCLANIYFNNLATPGKYEKHLSYASDWYKRIMTKDAANAYAANGLGAIFAEKGELTKARDTFTRVRELSGDSIHDSLLNLGHLNLALSKHPEALQYYDSYMKRSKKVMSNAENKGDVEVLSYIAFAYFDWAKQTEEKNNAEAAPADERYQQCINYLEQAMNCSKKESLVLRFNWCMSKLQSANCILQKLSRNIRRTAKEVEEALAGLEDSLPKIQTMIQWKKEGKKVPISTSTLTNFVEQCKTNIDVAKSHLKQERAKEANLEEMRELRKIQSEQKKKQYELEQLEKQQRESESQQALEQKARMKMEKVSNLMNTWKKEEIAKEAVSKKKGKDNMNPEAVGDDDNDVGGPPIADTPAALSDNDENEDQFASDVRLSTQTQRDLFGDDDDDDEDDDDNGLETQGDKPKKESAPLEKELFDDSSSDESEKEESEPSPAKRKNSELEGDDDSTSQLMKKAKVVESI